ncbi:unnamed protein product [Ilex paraguariensis]|uniref:GH16 domain-containing protein n=1 Tax=Ilex paraguariensis TaxID=185542 RepID=A0ABC8QUY1_9AQUA
MEVVSRLPEVTFESGTYLGFGFEGDNFKNINPKRFFIDKIPIRVFKNNRDSRVGYITQPMQLKASIWDGDSWATDGGKTKINWTHAPFQAEFRSFGIDGCPSYLGTGHCYSSKLWWNRDRGSERLPRNAHSDGSPKLSSSYIKILYQGSTPYIAQYILTGTLMHLLDIDDD